MLRQLRVSTGAERSGRFQTEGRYCGTGSATRVTSCVNPGARPVCADPVGREQGLILQHLAEEALGRRQIALRRQEEVNGCAVLVDGPVEVAPLAADLDVTPTTDKAGDVFC